jgi:hypothetical protein
LDEWNLEQGEEKMKKIKLAVLFLVAGTFLATLVVHAESNKQIQPEKNKGKAVTQIKSASTSVPQTTPLFGSRQGYLMVTDVLDGFGGESESDNYRIPVNSGGQPSAIGILGSSSFEVKAGFVHASHVMRGDANSDGAIGAGDIVYLLNYLFRGDNEPCPMESGDANCSGAVEAGDIVYLITYLYRGGPPPTC